jgi:hypothetical protein
MFETIIYIIVLLLSIAGLADIIRWAGIALLIPKGRRQQALIVRLNDDAAELDLRAAIECATRLGIRACSVILAVDCGLSPKVKDVCRCLCIENQNVILCKADDLQSIVTEKEFSHQNF